MKKWGSLLDVLIISCLFFISNFLLGQQHIFYGNTGKLTDSVFFDLKLQLEIAKQDEDEPGTIAQKHLQLGEFYHQMEVFSEAMDQYNTALKLLGVGNKDSVYVRLNNDIGEVHLSLNNYDMAKAYFEEALNTSIDLQYSMGQAISKGLMGACHEKTGAYEEALRYQKESLQLFEALGDRKGMAIVNENMGSIYEDLERYDVAYDYFTKAFEQVAHTETQAEANVLNNLGDIHRKKGNYHEGLEYTLKALTLAERIQDNHQMEGAHKDLSKVYALMGDYKKAHEHLLLSDDYEELLIEAQNLNQLNVLQTIHEANKKEAEIQLLKEQNKVSEARQNLLWVAFALCMVILMLLYGYFTKKRKSEMEKKAIEEKNLQREIQLKTGALSRYSLHLSQKNKILFELSCKLKNIASRKNMDIEKKLKELVKEIDFNLKQEHEWDEFMSFFKEIHPDFVKRLSSLSHNSLTPAEMRLGMLLRLNLSSKEIASILRVTPDSVRVARHRLRKKLPIDQKEELVNFMIGL